jgi:hypothetical protein
MWERNDGLLRGSRDERVADIVSLKGGEWNLDTLMDLHLGLLDHAEEVRLAAVESLEAIAERSPKPLTLTPAGFLARYIFSFTAASGAAQQIFEFLLGLNAPEAIRLTMEALEQVSRNEDFNAFVEILTRHHRLDLLRQFPQDRLGKAKRRVLRRARGEGDPE